MSPSLHEKEGDQQLFKDQMADPDDFINLQADDDKPEKD
jgi:hypothetical protein